MADRTQQGKVNAQILTALCKWCPETVAKEIVRGIVRGELPNVTVAYPPEVTCDFIRRRN